MPFSIHAAIESLNGSFSFEAYRLLDFQIFFGYLEEPKFIVVISKIINTYRKKMSYLSEPQMQK